MDWSYFDKPEFEMVNGKYLPDMGDGNNMATQIVTAYDCDGPFEFNEMEDDEDEDW